MYNDLIVEFRLPAVVRTHDVDVCAGVILVTERSLSLHWIVVMVGFCTHGNELSLHTIKNVSSSWRTYHHYTQMSRNSSVRIAMGFRARDRFPAGGKFSLLHRVHTGSGAHQASYPMGTGDPFTGDKADGAWSSPPPPPTSAEVKKIWICTSTPTYAFMT
jgi:hypothetical protein